MRAVGGVLHAYTDSSHQRRRVRQRASRRTTTASTSPTTAGSCRPSSTSCRAQGWKVGTVTSVPFDHASPAAMYAHNVHRDDYQDLARDMLGLHGIVQETRQGPAPPRPRRRDRRRLRPDGQRAGASRPRASNAVAGQPLHHRRRQGGHRRQERRQVRRRPDRAGGRRRRGPAEAAAEGRARTGHRLFGFFGTKTTQPPPLPHRRRRVRPRPRHQDGKAESYTAADLDENPTLADMTRAALTVLADQARPPLRPLRRGRRRRLRASTTTTSTTPSAPSTAARRPSGSSSTGSRPTATGTSRS